MTISEQLADLAAVDEYHSWLTMWTELTFISSGGFTRQGVQQLMTDEQKDAARTIPDVLDRLQEAWLELPDTLRPSHYTYPVCMPNAS